MEAKIEPRKYITLRVKCCYSETAHKHDKLAANERRQTEVNYLGIS